MRTLGKRKMILLVAAAVVCLVYVVSKVTTRGSSTRPVLPFRRKVARDRGHVTSDSRIPRILHQTWKTGEVPQLFKDWMKSWVDNHPGWDYWFWTDDDIRTLVNERYPQFITLFDGYPTPGYRADAFRYFVLHEFGGVYADIDMECLRPLDDFTEKHDCFVSQEPAEHAHFIASLEGPLVSNALMGCRDHHPFFRRIIDDLPRYSGWWSWNDILHATGPFLVTNVYHSYNRPGLLLAAQAETNPVHLAPPGDFQPSVDESMVDSMREMCVHSQGHRFLSEGFYRRQEQLCSRIVGPSYQNGPGKTSYTNHHWTHTWAGRRHDPWAVQNARMFFNVETLLQS